MSGSELISPRKITAAGKREAGIPMDRPLDLPGSAWILRDDRFAVGIVTPTPQGFPAWVPRYDTSAAVTSIQVDGQEFLGGEGLVDEFDIRWTTPPGYGDANPGGIFLKIGVGDLIRPDEKGYDFSQGYPVSRLADTATHGDDRKLTVVQSFCSATGWAYSYEKTYRIDASLPCLSIEYRLTNKGEREILTEQYNHNYFRLMMGEGAQPCALEHGFGIPEIETDWFRRSGRTTTISVPPRQPRYFMSPLSFAWHAPELELRIPGLERRVALNGDFSASRFALYADDMTVCPEIFTLIKVRPSESCSWMRTYCFPPRRDVAENVSFP